MRLCFCLVVGMFFTVSTFANEALNVKVSEITLTSQSYHYNSSDQSMELINPKIQMGSEEFSLDKASAIGVCALLDRQLGKVTEFPDQGYDQNRPLLSNQGHFSRFKRSAKALKSVKCI